MDTETRLSVQDFVDGHERDTSMRRRADHALEAHLWLVDSHHRNAATQVITEKLLASPEFPASAINDLTRDRLGRTSTWTMTSEMLREIEVGREFLTEGMEDGDGYVDSMPLTADMLPAPDGIVVFPYGIEFPLTDDNRVTTTTTPTGRYVVDIGCGDRWMIDGFCWFSHPTIRVAQGGRTGPGVTIFPIVKSRGRVTDRPFRPLDSWGTGLSVPPWALTDFTAWAFDVDANNPLFPTIVDETEADAGIVSAVVGMRMLVWLCFQFFKHELPSRERPSRPLFRRAKPVLSENRPETGDVIVYKLRVERLAGDGRTVDADAEPRWWRTRWIVNGHYARRRYAIRDEAGNSVGPVRGPDSVEGVTFEYRTVKIESFEKGSPNMPLVQKNKVYVLAQ